MEDEFLQQIRASFAQLDPVLATPYRFYAKLTPPFQFNGVPPSDPILSKRRIADTLTYGYLEMLGTLSKHKEGIEYVSLLSPLFRSSLFTTRACPVLSGYWRNSKYSLRSTI